MEVPQPLVYGATIMVVLANYWRPSRDGWSDIRQIKRPPNDCAICMQTSPFGSVRSKEIIGPVSLGHLIGRTVQSFGKAVRSRPPERRKINFISTIKKPIKEDRSIREREWKKSIDLHFIIRVEG